jgi:predicted alpha/beta-fold hydrolase
LNGVLRQPYPNQTETGVLMVHGYGGNFYSRIMNFLPEALAEQGFTTLALNMRDHDLGPKKNLFEENLQDIATGVDEMARRRYKNLFLYGHSMGTNRVQHSVWKRQARFSAGPRNCKPQARVTPGCSLISAHWARHFTPRTM